MMVQVSNGVDTMFDGSISENNINDSININIDKNVKLSPQLQSFPPSVIVNNNNNNNNGLILDHGENVVVSTPLDLESGLWHKLGILTIGYIGYITSNSWDPPLSKGGKLMTVCKCLTLKCGSTIDRTGKGYQGGKNESFNGESFAGSPSCNIYSSYGGDGIVSNKSENCMRSAG